MFGFLLAPKHKSTEKRESPSPAPKPRKAELSESGMVLTCQHCLWGFWSKVAIKYVSKVLSAVDKLALK